MEQIQELRTEDITEVVAKLNTVIEALNILAIEREDEVEEREYRLRTINAQGATPREIAEQTNEIINYLKKEY